MLVTLIGTAISGNVAGSATVGLVIGGLRLIAAIYGS